MRDPVSFGRCLPAVVTIGLSLWLVSCSGPAPQSSPPTNLDPSADAGADQTVTIGEAVQFDAGGSTDSDGQIVRYAWDFGDGASSEAERPSHAYVSAGVFTVTLTVTDDDGASATDSTTVTVTDSPDELFAITTSVSPSNAGAVILDPPGGFYEAGTVVSLTAQGNEGFEFSTFVDEQGQIISAAANYTFVVDGDLSLTALFSASAPDLFTLAVVATPQDAGSVSLDPPGGVYSAGTVVVLTAISEEGFAFAGYSGDADGTDAVLNLLIDEDKTIIALFASVEVALDVEVEPPEGGTVLLDPPGGTYESGSTVTLTAQPQDGFTFVGFFDDSGGLIDDQAITSVLLDSNLVIVARFARFFTLTIDVLPSFGGTISLDPPGGSYMEGSAVTLSADANDGYAFVEYTGDITTQDESTTVIMDADKNVTATFEFIAEIGDAGNLLVSGFADSSVSEFHVATNRALGQIVPSGTGDLNFAGGIDFGPTGDLFVVSVISNSILRYAGSDGASLGTFATGAGAVGLITLRFGPNGNLFASDGVDNSIMEYDGANGDVIGTFVAPGDGGLDSPIGLAFGGAQGNLYVVSKDNDRVLEYDGTTGAALGVFADLGAAGLTLPVDLAFGPDGDLFVTISGNDGVARIDSASGSISVFVSPSGGRLDFPAGLLIRQDNGNLLVVNQGDDSILEFDGTTGDFVGIFASALESESFFFMAVRP